MPSKAFQPRPGPRIFAPRTTGLSLSNTAEGGTDGVDVTIANSGGASGVPWAFVNLPVKFSALNTSSGTLSYDFFPAAADAAEIYWDTSQLTAGLTTMYGRWYLTPTTLFFDDFTVGTLILSASTYNASFTIDDTGNIRVKNSLGTVVAGPYQLSLGTTYRFEFNIVSHASAGSIELQIYAGHRTTPLTILTATGTNTNGGDIRWFDISTTEAAAPVGHYYVDDLNINTTWFPGPTGVAEPDETFAAQPHFGEYDWPAEATDDYANDSLDPMAAFFPPALTEPIETFAAQPHYGELTDDEQATEDYYPLPEQLEFLAPPEVTTTELIAAQVPTYDFDLLVPTETEDYANDTALERAPSFSATPVETFATQPLAEQYVLFPEEIEDYQGPQEQSEFLAPPEIPTTELIAGTVPTYEFDTLIPVEIEDYLAPPEQNEWTAPPEVGSTELLASQPHFGEYDWPATETDDYQQDSTLDPVPTLFPPVVVEPVETFASQVLSEQPWFPAEEVEDYQAAQDQSEFLAPPEVPTTELIATQLDFGAAFWPELETEDYQQDATVDLTPTFFPTAQEAIEVWASQPHFGEAFWDEQQTEDYQPPDDISGLLAAEPIATFAAQPLAEQWDILAAEVEDYLALPEQLEFLAPPEVATNVLLAAQPHFGEAFWPEAATEDYQTDSSLDLTPTFFATPFVPPLILTREGPKAGGAPAGGILTLTQEGAKAGGAAAGAILVLAGAGPKAGGAPFGATLTVTQEGAKAGGVAAGAVLVLTREGSEYGDVFSDDY